MASTRARALDVTFACIGHQQPSPFAEQDGVPSSALIDKLLREVPHARDVVLDEHTTAVLVERLQDAARLLSELSLTSNPTDRAESFRFLLSMTAYAIDAGLLNADPLEPMFSQPYRLHLLDWGGASPDAVYRRSMVRDDRSYRVHGRLGNAEYLSIDLRQAAEACTIARHELAASADGSFELFLGGSPRDEHWWPLPDGTTGFVVRELFGDWLRAQRSLLRIDCLDGEQAPRPEHSSRRVAAEFDLIGEWILQGAVRYWAERSVLLATEAKNRFLPQLHRGDSNLPTTSFGWWDLEPDEALIFELRDPEATFWGLHLATSLWHTLDYANRVTTHNVAQAHRDADGMYRFVVSGEDPGTFNWLDTMGLQRGVAILRFCDAVDPLPPTTEVVKRSEILERLPATRRCTPDQRREQIAERREGVARMICD
jgi:hypothetical protein